jgi:hypothetical protein
MSNSQALADFDPEACLCQMKVVPEDKRIDFQQLVRDPKTNKLKIKTVLRYHKDCPFHGIEVRDA